MEYVSTDISAPLDTFQHPHLWDYKKLRRREQKKARGWKISEWNRKQNEGERKSNGREGPPIIFYTPASFGFLEICL